MDWDKQEDESEQAYAAFRAYRDAPARTLQSSGLPLPDALKLAPKHRWVTRARAYDKHIEEFQLQARKDAITKAEAEYAQDIIATAFMGIQAAMQAIRGILARQAIGDGSAEILGTKDALALLKGCQEVLLRAKGEPTEHHAHDLNVSGMSYSELKDYLKTMT